MQPLQPAVLLRLGGGDALRRHSRLDQERGQPRRHNFLPYFTGQEKKGPREDFFYFSDDGDLTGLRFDNWQFVFAEQRAPGTLQVWAEPFVRLRIPKLFNLRSDPYDRADLTSNTYWDWYLDHAFLLVPAQQYVGKFMATFKDYPPRQKAATFTIDQVLEKSSEIRGLK